MYSPKISVSGDKTDAWTGKQTALYSLCNFNGCTKKIHYFLLLFVLLKEARFQIVAKYKEQKEKNSLYAYLNLKAVLSNKYSCNQCLDNF